MVDPQGPFNTPKDFGFDPSKFPSFREYQLESAQKVVDSTKPLILIEAPTGSGKSLLALTAHRLMPESTRGVYVVATKQLQDQIEKDFQVPVLKGRNNYPCLVFANLFPEVNSEICKDYLGDDECNFQEDCPYLKQKRLALSSPMCVLNYPLFLTEANYVGGFSGLDFLILDEVDGLEDHLMSFIEVSVTRRLLQRLRLGPPKHKTKLEAWQEWTSGAKAIALSELKRIGEPQDLEPVKLKEYGRLKRTLNKLQFLSDHLDESWVMEQEEKGPPPHAISFKPVKISPFASDNLWRHTSKALGMSATIMGPQAMAIELGLHSWDVDFISLPSPFPIESRPVEYIPVANVTHKTKDSAYPKISDAIDVILSKHPNDKVLIHAVSYDLTNFLMDYLRPKYHGLMSHKREDRASTLEKFKSYTRPVALISPSMERGVDLPGDLCRVIIVAKVPWPSLLDPQVNKRLHGFSDGSLWYARKTARSLVQMTGRATRFLGDYSESFILDEQFGNLVARNGALFPSWWRLAVRSGSL